MNWVAAAGLALSCGVSFAQIQGKGKINLQDTSGNSKIQNGSEFVFERMDDGRISFEGSGSPIFGTFKKQGLTLEAGRIDGIAATAQKTFSLTSATLSGKVHAVLTRPSASKAPNAVQQIDLTCPKADYLASAERWTLSGPVTVHREDLPAKEDLELSGSSATVVLYGERETAKGDVGLRSVTMARATLKMKTNRKQAKEKAPSEFEIVEYHFNGTADDVVFDDQARTITFRGNVHFWGDDPLLVGDMTGDSAVVTLDAKGQPKKISMSGEPGVTTIKQKPPPSLEGIPHKFAKAQETAMRSAISLWPHPIISLPLVPLSLCPKAPLSSRPFWAPVSA